MTPRLVYIGDVPVEASYHGSALLYRLLQEYPSDRLRIVEGNLIPPKTDRRLPGVIHSTLQVGYPRLLNSRLHEWYSRWLVARADSRVRQLRAMMHDYTPEAVLTVAHGYSWITAARAARERNLPLHLIVHDDWPRVVAPALRPRVETEFARVYRAATSRLCGSPFMAEDYHRRYGVSGTVLLPSRAPDAPVFNGVGERLLGNAGSLVFAFAGSINTPGYASLLRQLAAAIAPYSGELLIFGPLDGSQATAIGLNAHNVRLGGLLAPGELLVRLRRDADVLFVPMSFATDDSANMRMGFPSKLTDYTTVGLPLLVCGPKDCSAVRWAQSTPDLAEVVTSEDPEALGAAAGRLSTNRQHRLTLATNARAAGDRDFSGTAAQEIFRQALNRGLAHESRSHA